MSREQRWNDTDSGKQKYLENPVPLPLRQPHISHGLIWDGIQAYLVQASG